MTNTRKTVEDIITAKMEQRYIVGGLRREDEELLDDLVGVDRMFWRGANNQLMKRPAKS